MNRRNVAATAHTTAGLRIASRLEAMDVDVIEIRADALLGDGLTVDEIANAMGRIELPLLLTVRHPAEGGIGALSLSRRREVFDRLAPFAALMDIELRSAAALATLITDARANGVCIVISDHHFIRTPALADLLDRQRRAVHAGADIFKLATHTPTPRELARLLEFMATQAPCRHAVMGMGEFGQVSRLALAKAGSVLNYGYLDEPNATGQWEARELRQLITTIEAAKA